MSPTAWDLRNKLLAILNGAKHSGKFYVDLESGDLYAQTGGDPNSKPRMSICHHIMTRMMRPGDLILNDCDFVTALKPKTTVRRHCSSFYICRFDNS